eukprot:366536-Chlamydomonas_euryale.AAC.3
MHVTTANTDHSRFEEIILVVLCYARWWCPMVLLLQCYPMTIIALMLYGDRIGDACAQQAALRRRLSAA